MTIKRNIVVASALAIGLAGVGMSPSFAGDRSVKLDAQRLDKTTAAYSQYRGYARGWHGGRGWGGRGWNGGRGAAVAGAVGLGILGAAAVAANSGAYAEPYYDAPAYGYSTYPVYDEPVVVYQPRRYYRNEFDYGRGPWAQTYRGAPDPARGGR
jgi:hypothetical protein